MNRRWVKARKAAGLSKDLVLYCARHGFGSYLLSKTGNLKAVMDTMGHADVKSAMTYQHLGGSQLFQSFHVFGQIRPVP